MYKFGGKLFFHLSNLICLYALVLLFLTQCTMWRLFHLYYAPNFEKVGSILLSACPFVRPFKKNLKLGF